MQIEGLPEGIEIYAYKKPDAGEYMLNCGRIEQQSDTYHAISEQLCVKPKDGYSFVFDVQHAVYQVVKQIAPITITFTVTVDNTRDFSEALALPQRVKALMPTAVTNVTRDSATCVNPVPLEGLSPSLPLTR